MSGGAAIAGRRLLDESPEERFDEVKSPISITHNAANKFVKCEQILFWMVNV